MIEYFGWGGSRFRFQEKHLIVQAWIVVYPLTRRMAGSPTLCPVAEGGLPKANQDG